MKGLSVTLGRLRIAQPIAPEMCSGQPHLPGNLGAKPSEVPEPGNGQPKQRTIRSDQWYSTETLLQNGKPCSPGGQIQMVAISSLRARVERGLS